MVAAEKWKQQFRKGTDKVYIHLKCPFKVIYDKADDGSFKLVRYESKHIHKVEFWSLI